DAHKERPPRPDGWTSHEGGNGNDKNEAGQPPPEPDGGNGRDGGAPPKPPPDEAGPPPEQPPPSVNQDEHMLDMLESAPMFQQEDAKNRRRGHKFRGEDK